VNLANKSAVGPLSAEVAFTVKNQDAGSLSIDSSIDGRVVNVNRVEAFALGGSAHGAGVLPIDQPVRATADLTWKNLDASQVAAFVPQAAGIAGKISGSAKLAPSDDPRAIGPLRLTTSINPDGLHYKTIDIGNADITSYFNGKRFVLDESTLHAASGEIHLWARSARHAGGVRSSQLQIDFKDLDLDKLDRAFDTNPKSMPGKLAGNFVIIGSFEDRDTLFGEGTIRVTESNLTNLHAVQATYDYMNVGKGNARNDGQGQADLRLDNNTLLLTSARYFNRGVQLRAQATLRDIWNIPDSPLDGTVIGFLRPLKDIKLPYFADADRIFSALQQSVTTVKLTGTAREYHVAQSSLSEAGDTMRKLLAGEMQQK
jgi:hypothetical protein